MATKTEDRKIYEPEEIKETPLPEAVIWEEIVDAPTSLAELSSTDGAALEAATIAITGLGDLAYEDLVNELNIAAGAVTNAKIAVNAIQGDVIAASAITTVKISNNAIEAAKIAAGAVIAGKLAANSVVASNIQAGQIDATKMNVGTLSAITANLGTVTAGAINGLTITGGTIRTASSGTRVELSGSSNEINIYSGSTLRARGYSQGWDWYNSSATRIGGIFASSKTYDDGDGAYTLQSIVIDATESDDNAVYIGAGATGAIGLNIGTTESQRLLLTADISCIGNVDDYDHDVQVFGKLKLNNGLYADMAGICSSSGVITNGGTDALVWDSEETTTGVYTITHNMGHTDYLVLALPYAASGGGAPSIKVSSRLSNSFKVTTYDEDGTAASFQFYFMVVLFN